ncbi:hypothetical protein EDD11_008835 [Mortierella claussenii]|nr:hypothetical protein EDD11_008835 [Mortierella claussenii]
MAMAKISNFQAWEVIAMAWSEVKPQSIRNCFAHVPILNDDQKKELRSGDKIDPDVQTAIMDAREDIADRACLMDGSPRMSLEERFPGACGQGNSRLTPVTYTDTQRDYYTRLSALLEGSTSLNNVIQRMSTNREFMECFDVEPKAVPLDDLFPDEDDPDDEDYGNDLTNQDFLQCDEDGAWSEEKSEDERIDILTKAVEILQGDENKSLRHALDLAAEN